MYLLILMGRTQNMTKETVIVQIPKDIIPPCCENITKLVKTAIEHYEKNYLSSDVSLK